jgi:hypothetical protein
MLFFLVQEARRQIESSRLLAFQRDGSYLSFGFFMAVGMVAQSIVVTSKWKRIGARRTIDDEDEGKTVWMTALLGYCFHKDRQARDRYSRAILIFSSNGLLVFHGFRDYMPPMMMAHHNELSFSIFRLFDTTNDQTVKGPKRYFDQAL